MGAVSMKMIVTDLDRTLLRHDKTISQYTIDVFRRLQQQGVKIAIATARPKRKTDEFIQAINPDALVLHNGAVIYVNGEHHRSFSIPNNVAAETLQKVLRQYPKMRISAEIEEALYANFEIPDPDWTNTRTDFTDLPKKPVDKMLFSADDIASLKATQSVLSENFNAVLGEGWLLMAMSKHACKYLGVKEVASHFGLTPADVVAFGDDTNDIEMLKHCGVGVAVDNAIDEVKAVANFICESHEDDGVARWLEAKM